MIQYELRIYALRILLSSMLMASVYYYLQYESTHEEHREDYQKYDYYTLKHSDTIDHLDIGHKLDVEYLGKVGDLDYHYFRKLKYHQLPNIHPLEAKGHRLSRREYKYVNDKLELQVLRKRHKRSLEDRFWSKKSKDMYPLNYARYEKLDIMDPGLSEQWHIDNTRVKNSDFNVTGLWEEEITGKNVTVCILDDGVDFTHSDIQDIFDFAGSYDFNEHTARPMPRLSEDVHGTRCAGQIAAQRNNVCGVGLAYDARIAGVRILSKPISDKDEAVAINYGYQTSHIYSCSWGPPDDGMAMDLPPAIVNDAIVNGIEKGRGGLGSIFVFASGNGGFKGDNCNFDGYTNSIYSITVGAIDEHNVAPGYSEACTALLVSAYSGGLHDRRIFTSSSWNNQCTDQHGGTSAAAPFVAGVAALALSARPGLSWRDLQYIAINSAVYIQDGDPSWGDTYVGRKYSSVYGYGKVDAYRFVKEAQKFKPVNPQTHLQSPVLTIRKKIPSDYKGLNVSYVVTSAMVEEAHLKHLEHVVVIVNVQHKRRGDLRFELISPAEVKSLIGEPRKPDSTDQGFQNWPFMSVKHWYEPALGNWILNIKDEMNPRSVGMIIDWKIVFYAQSTSLRSKQPPKQSTKPDGFRAPTVHKGKPQPQSEVKLIEQAINQEIPRWLMPLLFGPVLVFLVFLSVVGVRAYKRRAQLGLHSEESFELELAEKNDAHVVYEERFLEDEFLLDVQKD